MIWCFNLVRWFEFPFLSVQNTHYQHITHRLRSTRWSAISRYERQMSRCHNEIVLSLVTCNDYDLGPFHIKWRLLWRPLWSWTKMRRKLPVPRGLSYSGPLLLVFMNNWPLARQRVVFPGKIFEGFVSGMIKFACTGMKLRDSVSVEG